MCQNCPGSKGELCKNVTIRKKTLLKMLINLIVFTYIGTFSISFFLLCRFYFYTRKHRAGSRKGQLRVFSSSLAVINCAAKQR